MTAVLKYRPFAIFLPYRGQIQPLIYVCIQIKITNNTNRRYLSTQLFKSVSQLGQVFPLLLLPFLFPSFHFSLPFFLNPAGSGADSMATNAH